ncbi:hypothetical protein IJD34_02915, partial [bacterium]|nr:hypothetical protein [bacterium]
REGLTFEGALNFYHKYMTKTMPEVACKYFKTLEKNYNFKPLNFSELTKEGLILCDRYRILLLLISLLVFYKLDTEELKEKILNEIKQFLISNGLFDKYQNSFENCSGIF